MKQNYDQDQVRIIKGNWVFGGYERDSKNMFAPTPS